MAIESGWPKTARRPHLWASCAGCFTRDSCPFFSTAPAARPICKVYTRVAHLLSYLNQVLFGMEISPRCDIGPGIFFPHTAGTVIGASKIGKDVTIFQGVTLGAREIDMDYNFALRPELGNHVVVGAGAKVLGGITLGDNVRVGANAVLLQSVPREHDCCWNSCTRNSFIRIGIPEVLKA